MPHVEIVPHKAHLDAIAETGQAPDEPAHETHDSDGGGQKSVLQAKLTKLAIQIGYGGE